MFKLIMHTIVAIFLLQIPTSALANWWQNPPPDTEFYLYGLGEGQTLALAQQQALADISGKLSTQVSASLDRVTQDTGVAYNDNVRRQINSEINKTELSQFQLLKSQQDRSSVIALVQLDRQKLAAIWQQQLLEQHAKLTPLLAKSITNFNQWKSLHFALPDAIKARNLSVQLFALDGTKPQADIHHQLLQHLTNQPLTVNVIGKKPKLNRAIQEQLAVPGLARCSANCQLTISYEIDTQHDSLFGEYVSDSTVLLKLHEGNKLLANAELTAQVTSVASYKSADEGAISVVINQIQQNNFWPLFGISL